MLKFKRNDKVELGSFAKLIALVVTRSVRFTQAEFNIDSIDGKILNISKGKNKFKVHQSLMKLSTNHMKRIEITKHLLTSVGRAPQIQNYMADYVSTQPAEFSVIYLEKVLHEYDLGNINNLSLLVLDLTECLDKHVNLYSADYVTEVMFRFKNTLDSLMLKYNHNIPEDLDADISDMINPKALRMLLI